MRQFPKRAARIFAATQNSELTTLPDWRDNFRFWLRALRDHLEVRDTYAGDADYLARCARDGLLYPPGEEELPTHRRRDVATLVAMARNGEPLPMDDGLTLSFWLDYLSEHPARRFAWHQFERQNGAVSRL